MWRDIYIYIYSLILRRAYRSGVHQVIKPGGAGPTAWKALIPSLKPLVEKKVIVGFDLGDEIVWNGVKWTDLNDTGESQA